MAIQETYHFLASVLVKNATFSNSNGIGSIIVSSGTLVNLMLIM